MRPSKQPFPVGRSYTRLNTAIIEQLGVFVVPLQQLQSLFIHSDYSVYFWY